jgi:RNA polymerase sigma-70 factor (ECF subfamily)
MSHARGIRIAFPGFAVRPSARPEPVKGRTLPQPDDAALIAQTLGGDQAAYAALVERHWRTAFGSAWAVLGNAGDAEEMSQETFVQVFEKLRTLRDPGALGGWVWRIARDCSLKHIRKHGRMKATANVPEPGESDQRPFSALVQGEERAALAAALDQLPPEMREALTMRYWDELEYDQMAQRSGVSEAALYQRVCRGLKRLRELLEGDRA